jgi:hypothetical protein
MQEIIFQVLYMNLSTRVFPVQMPPRHNWHVLLSVE